MITMTVVLHRRPDLSHEAFAAHWLNVHGLLVRSLAGELGIRRYVQTHPEPSVNLPFDGLAQVWFDSREALQAQLRTPEGRAAARQTQADERNFMDVDRSVTLWGSEHLIVEMRGWPGPANKLRPAP